jgi:hypothetical protein
MPELAGYWQDGMRVFTIEWQNDKYVVTAITAAGTSTRTLTDQSWNGRSLTWTYQYTDENGTSANTYTTISATGNDLTVNYSVSGGELIERILRRNSSPTPSYFTLPYFDNFSSASTGWDVYDSTSDAAGYGNGYYFVISKTKDYSSYGAYGGFFGDTVVNVDVTPASGPSDNNFSYNAGCRVQSNADGYIFEVSADGYFAVGYYTGGGSKYVSLLSGDEWQPASAIQKGLTPNHLTVTCAGSNIKFEVNGQVLFDGQDSTFIEGDISLGAATYDANNAPAEVHFSNLAVTAP